MIRVLVVDDSAVVRAAVTESIDQAADMEVVGVAADPYLARNRLKLLQPDVITLDVEMPRMDGLTFLKKLMNYIQMPVVMVSSLTRRGAETTLRALALGAVDFVPKPQVVTPEAVSELGSELRRKIRAAAAAHVVRPGAGHSTPRARRPALRQSKPSLPPERVLRIDEYLAPPSRRRKPPPGGTVVVIGASTGGTVAIEQVLVGLSPNAPGIVIAQHMPEAFTSAFAERLDTISAIQVVEASDGMCVPSGRAIVARGGSHLQLHRRGEEYYVEIATGPPINRHRPAVDVLFRSAAEAAGANAIGILMTGMGDDGARGLLDLREAGAVTIAQSEETCTVFGMPKVAIELGAASHVVPLSRIANMIGHRQASGAHGITGFRGVQARKRTDA